MPFCCPSRKGQVDGTGSGGSTHFVLDFVVDLFSDILRIVICAHPTRRDHGGKRAQRQVAMAVSNAVRRTLVVVVQGERNRVDKIGVELPISWYQSGQGNDRLSRVTDMVGDVPHEPSVLGIRVPVVVELDVVGARGVRVGDLCLWAMGRRQTTDGGVQYVYNSPTRSTPPLRFWSRRSGGWSLPRGDQGGRFPEATRWSRKSGGWSLHFPEATGPGESYISPRSRRSGAVYSPGTIWALGCCPSLFCRSRGRQQRRRAAGGRALRARVCVR